MVAFDACVGRLAAVEPLLPCEHGLADVYAAVVDYVGLYHAVAACFENLREAVAQQDVAQMTEVKGFVGVRRRIFHHYQRAVGRRGYGAVVLVGFDACEYGVPVCGCDDKV